MKFIQFSFFIWVTPLYALDVSVIPGKDVDPSIICSSVCGSYGGWDQLKQSNAKDNTICACKGPKGKVENVPTKNSQYFYDKAIEDQKNSLNKCYKKITKYSNFGTLNSLQVVEMMKLCDPSNVNTTAYEKLKESLP
jgi:hypothetical protein